MQTEVALLFAQLSELIISIPFVSIIGVSFVIAFFMRALDIWRGSD